MLGKTKNTQETQMNISTIISAGTVLDGNIRTPETARIDGTVNGSCTCGQSLIIGTTGQITGNIQAENVIISGKVEGDISASGKIEIYSTGIVNGDIAARALVIDEDARFDGKCTMHRSGNISTDASAPSEASKQNASEK